MSSITNEMKSEIKKLWNALWSGGIANPLNAMEQISYFLYMRRLSVMDEEARQKAEFTGESFSSVFEGHSNCRWDHFKHVEIAGSIDASEDNYEFVRHGGKWEKFDSNVTRIKEFEEGGIVKLYRLTACMQPTTIFSILQTEQYCMNKGIPFQIRFVDSPKMHSIMSLPRSAKEEIIEIYSKVDTITKLKTNSQVYPKAFA